MRDQWCNDSSRIPRCVLIRCDPASERGARVARRFAARDPEFVRGTATPTHDARSTSVSSRATVIVRHPPSWELDSAREKTGPREVADVPRSPACMVPANVVKPRFRSFRCMHASAGTKADRDAWMKYCH